MEPRLPSTLVSADQIGRYLDTLDEFDDFLRDMILVARRGSSRE